MIDEKLFQLVLPNPNHVLSSLLPDKRNKLFSNNFIIGMLCIDYYWFAYWFVYKLPSDNFLIKIMMMIMMIDWKYAISLQRDHLDPKFQVEGVAPNQQVFFLEN